MPEIGGVFIQAESELASINMVLGASVAGVRAMTSSSSPGVSLMQEGISYLAGCELPCLLVNVMRGGPGLGNISGSQADYFQSTRGGGHGDYRTICLAPASVQEMHDFPALGFYLADMYRNPVMIVTDGIMGQIMEGVDLEVSTAFQKQFPKEIKKDWVLDGCKNRPPRLVRSLLMEDGALEKHNYKLNEKYKKIEQTETRCEVYNMDNADAAVVCFGITARIAKDAVGRIKHKKVGIIRPITLWPFPYSVIEKYAAQVKMMLVVEHNLGQMVDDVRLGANGKTQVSFLGKPGGGVITPEEIIQKLELPV
jgi:2-oxoglutarate ferredoxin oxidoreductase subunit alpha